MYTSILENKKDKKMKNRQFIYLKTALLLGFIFTVAIGCEREASGDVEFASFPTTAEVFIDGFSGGLEYLPFEGSVLNAFTVDNEVKYKGSASMRFDVPNVGDPAGAFAGAIFPDFTGRDLSGYDALTFWAKGTIPGAINEIGFGYDFDENKFIVTLPNLQLTTNWRKYIIPIPDPYKLTLEKGMFWYGEGPEDGNGYTFWIDELKFENLGTIAQPQPAILDGEDKVQQTFIGNNIALYGTQTFNLGSGINETILVAPSYFTFTSSNVDVAQVSETGIVSIVGKGTADITAVLAGVAARGSLKITSSGALPSAPVPMRPEADVKSIYSDAYTSVTGSNFNPNFGGSTTQTTEATSNDDSVQLYNNNNFTGIIFNKPVDASALTHLHIDIYTQGTGTNVGIQIRDVGANGEIETNTTNGFPEGDDKDFRFTASGLTVGGWTSFDIPLGGDLTSQKNNLGALILTDGPDFILDNIYFYKQ
jgi:hypothetical protein